MFRIRDLGLKMNEQKFKKFIPAPVPCVVSMCIILCLALACAMPVDGAGIRWGGAIFDHVPLGKGGYWGVQLDFPLSSCLKIGFSVDKFLGSTVVWPTLPSTVVIVTKKNRGRHTSYTSASFLSFSSSLRYTFWKKGGFGLYLGGGGDLYYLKRHLVVRYLVGIDPWGFPDYFESDGLDWWPGISLMGGTRFLLGKMPLSFFGEVKQSFSYSSIEGEFKGLLFCVGIDYRL